MKLLAVVVAAVVALLLAVAGALVLFSLAMLGGGGHGESGPASQQALDDIPADLLPIYQGAAASCGMRWAVLGAVGKIETDHGRSTAPGVRSGANPAGAMGPMQFLAGTWAAYGVDADGDATVDVYDPADAIWGAARYLCVNGAADPVHLRSALWSYNHADWYVDEVLALAAGYEAAVVGGGDARLLADNPNLSLTSAARQDLLAGDIDQRVVDFLAWAVSRHTISVSALRSGHSKFVAGSIRISDHWYGRAVDIYAVDGELVTVNSPVVRAFAVEASALGLLCSQNVERCDKFSAVWGCGGLCPPLWPAGGFAAEEPERRRRRHDEREGARGEGALAPPPANGRSRRRGRPPVVRSHQPARDLYRLVPPHPPPLRVERESRGNLRTRATGQGVGAPVVARCQAQGGRRQWTPTMGIRRTLNCPSTGSTLL